MSIRQNLQMSKIVIVTHVFATGPAQELESYLRKKSSSLMFVGHPFSFALDIRPFYRIYDNGKLTKERVAFAWKLPNLFMYLKDMLLTLFWTIKYRRKFDLYIGADPLNALTGIILRKIGKVRKTVFYSIDYAPNRFHNKLLNWIYHRIDKFCAEKSDYVWNLSERMIEMRREKGVKKTGNQLVVPIGVHFERIKRLDIKEINRKYLVYMGHLRRRQGLELMLDSLPDIVARIPDVKLVIIGMGELEEYLKKKVKEIGLRDYVEFKGYIEDHKEVEHILTKCAVGLALYEPGYDSFVGYTDPSKPKQYLACGLPMVITRVPWIAEEIEKEPMGVVTDYDKGEIVKAAIKLLSDNEFYSECRKNAIEFASKLSWDKIYAEVFELIN